MTKYTYTPEIKAKLAAIQSVPCPPSSVPMILASLYFGTGLVYERDIARECPQAGGNWAELMRLNYGKAKFYW